MVFSSLRAARHPWWVLGLRAWVLVVLMLGTLASSLGHANSHGIAALAAVQHESEAEHGHAHAHEEGAPEPQHADGDAGHAHHNSADHSHDKAHALPANLAVMLNAAPVWWPLAHPLMPGCCLFRLDRPPMT